MEEEPPSSPTAPLSPDDEEASKSMAAKVEATEAIDGSLGPDPENVLGFVGMGGWKESGFCGIGGGPCSAAAGGAEGDAEAHSFWA